jgi:tetratricopeptide (TPR) repeat protein
MTHRAVTIVLAALALLWVEFPAAGEELNRLSSNGITVSYPPKMEAQAKKVLDIAVKSIQPSIEIHKQTVSLLANPSEIAAEIADLLGADEIQEKTRVRLAAFKHKSEVLAACFSNIRLVEKAEAVASEGLDAGVVHVRYVKDADEFKMGIDLENRDPDDIKRSYYPIFVNADGTIRAENKIATMAMDFLGSSKLMLIAPIHESIGQAIAEQLNLYHPFTRWFNEGVSGWATRRIVSRIDPKLTSLTDQMFTPGPQSKRLRDKVNLLAWPQPAFQNRRDRNLDGQLEVAQTQFSVEVISNLLGGNRGKMLARIITDLKHNANADTDTICEVVKKITGSDLKKTLLTYVPKDIADGARIGEPKRLTSQAEKLVEQRKWADATAKLRRALEMNPYDVNARLNLAWIERETGERFDSEIQVFTAARLLQTKKYSFHLFAPSVEGNYVLGKLAILLGDLESAKKLLEPVLEAKPDHVDAKRAMESVKAIESAAKGQK